VGLPEGGDGRLFPDQFVCARRSGRGGEQVDERVRSAGMVALAA
jgi:hypothetical protein